MLIAQCHTKCAFYGLNNSLYIVNLKNCKLHALHIGFDYFHAEASVPTTKNKINGNYDLMKIVTMSYCQPI